MTFLYFKQEKIELIKSNKQGLRIFFVALANSTRTKIFFSDMAKRVKFSVSETVKTNHGYVFLLMSKVQFEKMESTITKDISKL